MVATQETRQVQARDEAAVSTMVRHLGGELRTALDRRFESHGITPQQEAVRGIDLEVKQGEIFGSLGPNGAGKSTTISMLCTLLKPTAGSASVAGIDVVHDPARVRQRIGLVFQDPSLDDQLTGRENLEF